MLDIDPISRVGRIGDHRDDRDVVDPMSEPRGDGPSLTSSTYVPRIPFTFELPNLPDDLGFRFPTDMPPIRSPVLAHAHSHATVPVTIRTVVEGGGSVGPSRWHAVPDLRRVRLDSVEKRRDVSLQARIRDTSEP